jgi:hypothetical protein
MTTPIILQQGNRQAVVNDNRVQYRTIHPRNKKKPLEKPVWPEVVMVDEAHALFAGLLWLKRAYMELGER